MATTADTPLVVTASHALFELVDRIDLTDAAEPGLATGGVAANLLRVVAEVGDGDVAENDIAAPARVSKRMATTLVTAATNHGLVVAEPPRGKNRHVELTDAGRALLEVWQRAERAIESDDDVGPLRQPVEQIAATLPLELPHFPAQYGGADPSALGAPFCPQNERTPGLPLHGRDWKPVPRPDGDTTSRLSTLALLSQVIMALTVDYEDRFPWPLASTLNVVRHIGTTPTSLSDLPVGHGVAGNGKSLLERHLIVEVVDDGGHKAAVLTDRGEQVLYHHPARLQTVEAEWADRHGDDLAELRAALDLLATRRDHARDHPLG